MWSTPPKWQFFCHLLLNSLFFTPSTGFPKSELSITAGQMIGDLNQQGVAGGMGAPGALVSRRQSQDPWALCGWNQDGPVSISCCSVCGGGLSEP